MSCKVVSLLALLTLFGLVTAQNGWCNIKSCTDYDKGEHTLCKYQQGVAQACFEKGNLGGGLTAAQKQSIVELHNELRQNVASGNERRGPNGPQPRAKTGQMPNLQWDDTLAAIAQRWADQCAYGHDSCRDVPAYQVGQNVAYSGTTGNVNTIDILGMVRNWYNEVQYFNRNEVKNFSGNLKASNGKDIGHYTQLVWGNTKRIGCGLRNYYKSGFNRRYMVCNYGPSGNFPNQPIYET